MPYQSIFRPGLFSGQTVLVTGGGSGIGRCTAHELVSLGASVAPTDRDRLAYMADLISEFQTMAIDMRLGMLARILSVAVAETSRLLETPDAAASPARNRR